MKVQYSVSEEFLREEFIRSGKVGNKARSFSFDPANVTPEQRKLLLDVMPFEALRRGEPLRLLEFRHGKVSSGETLELDYELTDVGDLFFCIEGMLAAANQAGIDLLEKREENDDDDEG